jgi:cob(I)alamin adenosyltransferase
VFITDEHQEIEPTEEQLVNLIDNSDCGFEVIGKINTKMSDEQRQTINNWIADNIPELIIDFSIVSNSYITNKNNIQKHEIDLYEKLKKLYEQIPPPHNESVFNLLLGSLIK